MAEQSEWIIETTAATFDQDVIERSREQPVVVDLWAPWCQPCRQLTPLLEALVGEYAGRFVLAKVNVDAEPELAAAFGVQSIPFVVAIRDGQPVNHFLGILSPEQLQEWIGTVLPSAVEELVSRAESIAADDPVQAERLCRDALQQDPGHAPAKIQLASALLAQQRDDEARNVIDDLEQRGFLEPEAERIKSQLELRTAAAEAGDLEQARRAAADVPDDPERQLKLADALAVAGKHEEALEICLTLVRQSKTGIGEEAKQTMLRIFGTLGDGSELVGSYRRKLATALY